MSGIKVAIIMGSESDAEEMKPASDILNELGIKNESRVISAHRTPDRLREYILDSEKNGVKVFIGGAGMAAALPGVIAAHTHLPVLGVPIESKSLKGMDSLLSIVQMPPGISLFICKRSFMPKGNKVKKLLGYFSAFFGKKS